MKYEQELYFAHEQIRDSQKELIDAIKEAVNTKISLIANAPTGLGKSAGAISPALTYALKNNKTVVFITPKHTQHRIAIETIRKIKDKYNINFTTVDLIGKRHLCAQPGVANLKQGEFSEYCKEITEQKLCTYYNKFGNKNKISIDAENLISNLKNQTLHVEEMKDQSAKAHLCPYEIAMQLAKDAKVIIADYHHILNPSIRDSLLKRMEKNLSEMIIIFDEAHNLPERARDMLSSQLSNLSSEYASREATTLGFYEIASDILVIKDAIEKLGRQKISIENKESIITKQEFLDEVNKKVDYDQLIGDLMLIAKETSDYKKKSFANAMAGFLTNWQGPDESFVRTIEKGFTAKNKPYITINYKCLDPALAIKPIGEESHCSIFMSGTLSPTEMYKDLFGLNTKCMDFISPFPKINRLNIIVPDTTTKFTARTNEMYERIAKYCSDITNNIPGNTAIFFPSYNIRDSVNNYLKDLCSKTTILEIPNMSKPEKAEILEKLKQYEKIGAVLLGATSGSFGEGVDFPDNLLKCVIVVGIPLDRPNIETQELISYYDKKFGKGWDYGYIMPAIIKCLQNAGRCIRSETDKGVIVYLDQRYTWDSYFKCFPRDSNLRITKEPVTKIKEFFDNHNLQQ